LTCLFSVTVALTACAWAQTYTISTVAGGGLPPTPMAATSANVYPAWVAVDAAGTVYFSSMQAVFKIDTTGKLTRVAGAPGGGNPLGDGGPATSAYLDSPWGLALDSAGDLYIVEIDGHRVRKVTPGGTISTVAGNGTAGYTGDGGLATGAQLNFPGAVAVDSNGNLYIADTGNNVIRKIGTNGKISTVAGNTTSNYSGDRGPATSAALSGPTDVAVDSSGGLYIADAGNAVIRKVNASGIISTCAGGGKGSTLGVAATSFALSYPAGVALDSSGNLYIADWEYPEVFVVSASGTIHAAAGGGNSAPGDGGPATSAALGGPENVAVDSSGNLLIADYGAYRVRKVNPSGVISTVAGTGALSSGDGGPATSAAIDWPEDVKTDTNGNIFIADYGGQRVRKVTLAGVISTVAGTGTRGYSGDNGPATSAELAYPNGLAVDSSGNLYISDSGNQRVRKVTTAGVISTVAGNGTHGYSGDNGPATSAELGQPQALAIDSSGNLFIADGDISRIRKVTPSGTIATVAGTGTYGYSGDGGPATSAEIGRPNGLAVDSAGNLFISDSPNYRVRKVTPGGTISTVAGTGNAGFSGDGGQATKADFGRTIGLAVDSSGNLFIADYDYARIRMVTAGGIVSTVAGSGGTGYSGDGGPATSATFNDIFGISIDSSGKIYIADAGNGAVRELTPAANEPSINPGGVVPVGSPVNTVQPGEWISIYGSNLAGTTAVWNNDFPTSLAGTTVTIDGRLAYIWYVSPGQINVQVPDDSSTGTVPVVVTTAAGSGTSTVTLASVAPAFLLLDSTHVTGIIVRSNGSGAYGGGTYDIIGPTGSSLGYPTVAAKADDVVELFATGFGPTNPTVLSGQAFSGAAGAVDAVNVKIGSWNVTPPFAGLSGAGLVQINLTIPGGLGTGDVPLVATVGGSQTPSTVVISLQ
jgi:uncharacterized protein (TIGR03437 family)